MIRLLSLLSIALFVTGVKLSAQVYQPFPTNNADWGYVVESETLLPGGSKHLTSAYLFIIDGSDTVIKNNSYKKVIQRGWGTYDRLPIQTTIAQSADMYFCAIREVGKKLFVVGNYDSAEVQLWDFDIHIGDTIKQVGQFSSLSGMAGLQSVRNNIVKSIDSVLVGNSYRKRFLTPDFKIIDGLGIDGSPFYFQWQFARIDTMYITCFHHNSDYYSPLGYNCFYLHPNTTPVAITQTTKYIDGYIYPNPFTDQLNINTDQPAVVTIYNTIGIKMLQQKISLTQTLINTQTLPQGMYSLSIKNGYGDIIHTQKVIKQ